MPPVNTWSFSSKQWLSQILPSSRAHARLLTFEYSAPPQNDFSWQHFFLLGDELLTALFDTRCSEDKSRPLLCVCHSLGGIILKQTLCIANEQHYHYGSLVNALAGIIFLGTPHTAHTDSETLSRCITIYNATAKISAEIPGQRLLHETAMLAHLATRFEAVYTPASTLSVIEGKATRVRESRMKSRMQLVGTGLLSIYSKHADISATVAHRRSLVHDPHPYRKIHDLSTRPRLTLQFRPHQP